MRIPKDMQARFAVLPTTTDRVFQKPRTFPEFGRKKPLCSGTRVQKTMCSLTIFLYQNSYTWASFYRKAKESQACNRDISPLFRAVFIHRLLNTKKQSFRSVFCTVLYVCINRLFDVTFSRWSVQQLPCHQVQMRVLSRVPLQRRYP